MPRLHLNICLSDIPRDLIRKASNGKSPYGEYEPGDTGVVDGYCRGGNDVPYAIVILEKNFRFVMANLEQLEQIGSI